MSLTPHNHTGTVNPDITARTVSIPEASWNTMSWLLTEGRSVRRMADLVQGCVTEMRRNDIPVDRFFIGATLIHAQCAAYDWKWEDSAPENVTEVCIPKTFYDRRYELFGKDAPLIFLEDHDRLRITSTDPNIPANCTEIFQEKGYMDLYGRSLTLQGEYGGGITWACRQAFNESHLQFFDSILPALSAVIQFFIKDLCMSSLLRTYLGHDPGTRVHGGVARGSYSTIRSVVWFSDVRGFTRLSRILDTDSVILLLNQVFELSERVLRERGGEVLKFMGDGLMGVFHEKDGKNLCTIARQAAHDFQVQLADLRSRRSKIGLPGAEVGVGLHYGDVSYGNIGSPTRLDFTVIGNTVNFASRVEGLCSTLQASVLASKEFVHRDESVHAWKSRGEHKVKGVEEAVEVFELCSRKRENLEELPESKAPNHR